MYSQTKGVLTESKSEPLPQSYIRKVRKQEGKETYHAERIFGEMVTEQDIVLRSLHFGLDTLTSLLDVHPTHQNKPTNIALALEGALKKVLNTSPHTDQMESIKLIRRMNELVAKYPAINITLIWLPKKSHFVGF